MSTTPYAELEERLGLEQGIPYTPDWSAASDFMGLIVEHALETKPKVIFECSSGLTTVMLARCCQMNGDGKVISLENGAEYAENTRNYFERYNLDEIATVIDAPLEKIDTNGSEFIWYKTDEINAQLNGQKIDMLVIDGPPGFIQKTLAILHYQYYLNRLPMVVQFIWMMLYVMMKSRSSKCGCQNMPTLNTAILIPNADVRC